MSPHGDLQRPKSRWFTEPTVLIVGVLALVGAAVWLLLLSAGYDPSEQSAILSTAQSLVTIIAIVTGGFWAYRGFVRQRLAQPRLNVSQQIVPIRVDNDRTMLYVTATLHNIGETRIALTRWRLRAEQILPLSRSADDFLAGRSAFTQREAPWTTVAGKSDGEFSGTTFAKVLEPGEVDTATAVLVIPGELLVARVYSHFSTSVEYDSPGWPIDTAIELRKPVVPSPLQLEDPMQSTKIIRPAEGDAPAEGGSVGTKQEPYEPPRGNGPRQEPYEPPRENGPKRPPDTTGPKDTPKEG